MSNQSEEGIYLPASEYLDALAGEDPEPGSVMAEVIDMASSVISIIHDYDVRNMTPAQMAEMSRRLYLAGAIDLAEFAVMSFQPHMATDFDVEAETYRAMQQNPNRPRDFIAAWENHLRDVQFCQAGGIIS